MRKMIITSALFAGGVGVLAIGAVPAFAATGSTTPVTVEVTGGALTISAPAGSVDLGSATASTSAQTVTGHLGDVTVTDNGGSTVGWSATVSAPDFTGPQTISTSTWGLVTYSSGAATTTGTVTTVPYTESTLNPGGPATLGTNVSGANTATWDPTIAVIIPANALAGTYGSSLTHSVS